MAPRSRVIDRNPPLAPALHMHLFPHVPAPHQKIFQECMLGMALWFGPWLAAQRTTRRSAYGDGWDGRTAKLAYLSLSRQAGASKSPIVPEYHSGIPSHMPAALHCQRLPLSRCSGATEESPPTPLRMHEVYANVA